jgi:hypothetical protein
MAVTKYGSIDDPTTTATTAAGIDPEVETADAAPSVDDPFDADPTYYLKHNPHNSRWTTQRIWNLVLPLLVAGLLIGGAALFLLRDFSNLYPGQGNGGGSRTASYREPTTSGSSSSNSDESKSYTSSRSSSNKHHHSTFVPPNDDIGASCSLHPDCSLLIGNCCPTTDGKTLECCGT